MTVHNKVVLRVHPGGTGVATRSNRLFPPAVIRDEHTDRSYGENEGYRISEIHYNGCLCGRKEQTNTSIQGDPTAFCQRARMD